jgi:hypothetical protein
MRIPALPLALLAVTGIFPDRANARDDLVPVCKIWREMSEQHRFAPALLASSLFDASVYVGSALRSRFYFSTFAHSPKLPMRFANVEDASGALDQFVKDLQERGECHGSFTASGLRAEVPATGIVSRFAEGESEAFKKFLNFEELGPSVAAHAARPAPPRYVEVRTAGGLLVGGLTELFPSSGIFVTNQHVLGGLTPAEVASSFSAAHLSLDDNRCVRFRGNSAGELDFVLVVPKFTSFVALENSTAGRALRFSPEAAAQLTGVNLGDDYFTYHYGTAGDAATRAISSGQIGEVSLDGKFFLPPLLVDTGSGGENRTSPRASGSLVYVRSPGTKAWKAGGVLECKVPPKPAGANGAQLGIAGETRAIALSSILDSEAVAERCDAPGVLEARPASDDCVPINARGAGGP